MESVKSSKKVYTLQVALEEVGKRLDHYIVTKISGETRSQIQYLILNGKVTINSFIANSCAKKVSFK